MTSSEKSLLTAKRQRHIDWRDGPKAYKTRSNRWAAYVQQASLQTLKGEAYTGCGNQKGSFKSCRVLVTSGDVAFRGACGNCSFNSGSVNCSLRADDELPGWVKKELAKQNPEHPLLKDAKVSSKRALL